MSRFGLGHTVAKTIHKYPKSRFPRLHLLAKLVHRYPILRFGARNDKLDIFEEVSEGGLTLDSLVSALSVVTIADVTPFVVTLTMTHTGPPGANPINLDAVDLTFNNGGDVAAEFPTVADVGNATQLAEGETAVLTFTVTPDVAPTNGVVTVGVDITATDADTLDVVTPVGTPTDTFSVTNEAEAELTILATDTGGSVSKTALEPEFEITLIVSNPAAALANDLLVTAFAFTVISDPLVAAVDVTGEYTFGTPVPDPAVTPIVRGTTQAFVIPVTIDDLATEHAVTRLSVAAGFTSEDAVTGAVIVETNSTTPQNFAVTA